MLAFLLKPLEYDFFVRALVVGVLSGFLCGVMGVYITTRRMSYVAHGLSHAILGGAVISYILGLNFYLGAGVWGFGAAILIQYLTVHKVYSDSAIGIVTTASFAFGVALISMSRQFTQSFEAALFGNVLGVTPADVWIIVSVALALLTLLFLFYRPLLFWSFDRELAQVHGVPVRWMDLLFALMLAALLVSTLQVLGVTLIISAVVIPASIARLLTHHFARMLFISSSVGAIAAFLGLYLSYYFDVASGASVVLLSTALFAAVLGFSISRQKLRTVKSKFLLLK